MRMIEYVRGATKRAKDSINDTREALQIARDALALYDEAQAEIARLQALLERREKLLTSCMMQRDSLQAEVERSKEVINEARTDRDISWVRSVIARKDALEEAAHLIECDAHAMSVAEAAAAIRALKDAKP